MSSPTTVNRSDATCDSSDSVKEDEAAVAEDDSAGLVSGKGLRQGPTRNKSSKINIIVGSATTEEEDENYSSQ